jgi:hypothetical protein
LALKGDGTMLSWGYNYYGELGNGNNTDSLTPVAVSTLGGVVGIAAGCLHNLAVTCNGTIWTWGNNSYGQLGNGGTASSNVPVMVTGWNGRADVGAGPVAYHSLACKPVPLACRPGPGGPGGFGIGLKGDYYDNKDFTALKVTRVDGAVNFNWGTGAPDPSMGADTFSVRWMGYIEAPRSETVTFYTVTDDGVRLWVNGQLLINKWIDQGPTEYSGTIALAGGQRYQIKMDYYENSGGATAHLLWSSPSMFKQVIPRRRLYPAWEVTLAGGYNLISLPVRPGTL